MLHLLFLGLAAGLGLRTALELLVAKSMRQSKNSPNGLVKDALQVPLRERRTLQVLVRLDLLGNLHRLLVLDRRHLLLPQALSRGLVVAQIELGADQDDGDARSVVLNLGVPLQNVSQS